MQKSRDHHLTIEEKSCIIYMQISNLKLYGAAKVSTGVLRYDKRGGQDNPVKLSNLKLNDNNKVALAA